MLQTFIEQAKERFDEKFIGHDDTTDDYYMHDWVSPLNVKSFLSSELLSAYNLGQKDIVEKIIESLPKERTNGYENYGFNSCLIEVKETVSRLLK